MGLCSPYFVLQNEYSFDNEWFGSTSRTIGCYAACGPITTAQLTDSENKVSYQFMKHWFESLENYFHLVSPKGPVW
jgi:hypothetical protein